MTQARVLCSFDFAEMRQDGMPDWLELKQEDDRKFEQIRAEVDAIDEFAIWKPLPGTVCDSIAHVFGAVKDPE